MRSRRWPISGPPTGRLASRWVRLDDGLAMHYRVSTGPGIEGRVPVILVHGLAVSSRYMIPIAEHLAPYFRVYAPDLPGFGRSDKPEKTLGIAALADALAAWMRALGLSRAHLVGNSLGCNVLVELALRHETLIDRLVLQGPTVDPRARSVPQQAFRWLLNSRREPSHPGLMAREYAAAGFRRAIETFLALLRHPIEKKLPSVDAPVLVVRGTRDPIVPHAWARRAADLLPRGRLVEIPGAAHTMNLFAPLEFTRVLRPFLDSHAGDRIAEPRPRTSSSSIA